MRHTLTLEMPKDMYEPLAETARQTGRTLEELIIAWLKDAIRKTLDDPVEEFIGALGSDVSDWADQHDQYIGQSLSEETRDVGRNR